MPATEQHDAQVIPCSLEAEVHRLKREVIWLRSDANYYRAMHERSLKREAELKKTVEELQAQLRYERQQRFGRTGDESSPGHSEAQAPKAQAPVRKRGQQRGNPAPRRRSLQGLPVREERAVVAEAQRVCSCCGEPLVEGALADEEVSVVEVEVKAHVRKIRKEVLVRRCRCHGSARVVTGQVVGPLFGGSHLGVSVWVELLLGRFAEHLPMRRVLGRLADVGCPVPAGTVASMQPRLLELIAPVVQAIAERNRSGTHWHVDETPHKVFVRLPDKTNHTWWMWVFVGEDTTVYVMSPSRSRQALVAHFGEAAKGVLSVDRYSAYKAWVKGVVAMVLAFCWTHVRRDFLKAATEWPTLEPWCAAWISRIGGVYHANNARLEGGPKEPVQAAIADVLSVRTQELARHDLHPAQRKVLTSLEEHWEGLTRFVDDPTIPMDNNTAERALRMEVVARKAFNGCGSIASAHLLAGMATILNTLRQHGVDARTWLTRYLTACAAGGGRAPPEVTAYLPWTMVAAARDGTRTPDGS
jgi:transposase